MTSMGLMKTATGDVRFATMSTATGKHIGQMRLEVGEDHLTLVTAADSAESLIAGLAKHRVADDIRWTAHEAEPNELAVWAETTAALEASLAGLPGLVAVPGVGTFADGVSADGLPYRVSRLEARFAPLGVETAFLRPLGGDAEAQANLLQSLAGASGGTPVSQAAYDAKRVQALWPDDKLDLGDDEPTLASTRLVGTVDWDKGCFLGQEVFVMARDRGQAPKRLVAFTVLGDAPSAGTEVLTPDGKVAGRIGSTAPSAGMTWLLTLIKKRFAETDGLVLNDGRVLVSRDPANP